MRKGVVWLFSLWAGFVGLANHAAAQSEADLNRYYRAVAVLQTINEDAKQEKEEIPRAVFTQDETESLIHHADELYVYKVVADELSGLEQHIPRARLFGAYARLALGQRLEGTRLLMDYVTDIEEVVDRHYVMIVENLAALEDWTSVYIICLEWEEKKSQCSQIRTLYAWKALTELKRHEAALQMLARNETCLGWKLPVYEAISTYSLGKAAQARQVLADGKKKYPQETGQIANLWYKMAPSTMRSILGE